MQFSLQATIILMRLLMEGLSGKPAHHLCIIFKQRILSICFFLLFWQKHEDLFYTQRWQTKWRKKSSFLFKHKHFKQLGGNDCCWETDPPLCSSCCWSPSSWVLCNLACTCAVWHCWLFQLMEHWESPTHKTRWITCLPLLWGSMQSDKVPSNNLVLLSRFQKLTRKSVANPPMQRYLELNKTEKVRTQEKTVHNEIKRLHLLDSALASPALWFNLLSPCYTFPHLFPSSYFF